MPRASGLILVVLILFPSFARADGGVEIKTEHFDLYCEGPNPEEYGRLLEQLYSQLTEFFHAEPQRRLRVKVLADEDSYIATLKDAGAANAEELRYSNGIYYTGVKTAFIKRRFSEWLTSMDIVHECSHQFHCLARMKDGQWPLTRYYAEGLASYLSRRHWDGTTLHAGDAQFPYDYDMKDVLERFRTIRHRELRNIITDPGYDGDADARQMDYPEAEMLVRFLIEHVSGDYRALAAMLDNREDPGNAWDATVAKSKLNLNELYEQWIEANTTQDSFQAGEGCWVPVADWIEGSSASDEPDANGDRPSVMMLLRDTPERTKVEIRSGTPKAQAGIIISTDDAADWSVLIGPQDVAAQLTRELNGAWKIDSIVPLKNHPATVEMDVRRSAEGWTVDVADELHFKIPAPVSARLGATISGRAEFRFAAVEPNE